MRPILLRPRCPQCNTLYNLTTDDPRKLIGKSFTCSKCRLTLPFTTVLPQLSQMANNMPPMGAQMPPQGQMGQMGAVGQLKTHIHDRNVAGSAPARPPRQMPRPMAPVTLEVQGGPRIPIPAGQWVVGRDSPDSRAQIKLVPDPCMSREAARIEVRIAGNMPVVSITPLQSRNITYVNNTVVHENQRVQLRPGDVIFLGNTRLTVKI